MAGLEPATCCFRRRLSLDAVPSAKSLVIREHGAKVIVSSGRCRGCVLGSRSQKLGYRHSLDSGRVEKVAVAGDHDDVRVTDPVGGREVDRVIPTQLTDFRQLAGAASEGIINLDKVELLEQGVELCHRVAQLPSREAAKPLGLSERSARLRVQQPDAHNSISAIP
jgi:hypothetical protein